MDSLQIAHHSHDVDFLYKKFESMPWRFRGPIAGQYSRTYKKKGRREANLSLIRKLKQMPTQTAVTLAGSNSDLIAYADRRATMCSFAKNRHGAGIFQKLADAAWSIGIQPPEIDGDITEETAIERLSDPLWWRRALRKHYGREVEKAARDVGLVHKGAGIYSSDETLYRRDEQKTRNRKMLEEILAVNEEGQEFTLAELSDLSVSNPVIRRGELMTRIAGFEKVANDLKHKALFITLTCPSRFHSHTIRNKQSVENSKYDGSTPRDAQAYLQKVFSRIRAKLARHRLTLYGFRVAEPNHDGCVHWHLLVFAPGWGLRRIKRTFIEHGLRDSPEERGAKKHRVTFVEIDPARGTASGYIAKYIAKNIDGFAIDQDMFGGCPLDAAARVDAWASCWGIRQFQQLGGPPVTVWRELRRIEGEESGILETARDAADRGDWAAFVKAMGGPACPRKSQPVKLAKATDLIDIDEATGEILRASPVVNKYGEPAAAQIIGVSVGDQITATRWHQWELMRGKGGQKKERCGGGTDGASFEVFGGDGIAGSSGHVPRYVSGDDSQFEEQGHPANEGSNHNPNGWIRGELLSGANATPWSSVNNCTRPIRGFNNDEVKNEIEYFKNCVGFGDYPDSNVPESCGRRKADRSGDCGDDYGGK